MAEQTLTQADLDWLNQPVDVTVEPDNQKWLDTLLELTQEELINFATLQYGVPEAAAKASSRNELLQLIVLANRAGGGAAVLRSTYRYLKELDGILPAQIVVRGSRPLYLTRGSGTNLQVYDKTSGDWISYQTLVPGGNPGANNRLKTAARRAAAAEPQVVEKVVEREVEKIVEKPKFLLKPTRAQVEAYAVEAGVGTAEEVADQEKYPSMQSLVDAIEAK